MEEKINKLSPKAQKIVESINNFLASQNDDNSILFKDDINQLLSNIERIKKEFESTIFFIVISGGIKSGKSTLINLLSHKTVSTTKQGKETTLRPAIIINGNEDKILLFNTTKTEDPDDVSNIGDLAVDYIKGFITKEELNTKYKIKIKEKALSEQNLEKYLTQKVIEGEIEPKLINIQVKIDEKYQNSLLSNSVAIIDTPGIDGVVSGADGIKHDNNDKTFLMKRVDLMLFLQSSVTPINKESSDYIKDLKSKHSITNMSLFHNKFTLKPWRDDHSHENDYNAIENAKNLFKHLGDLQTYTVDLAKAEDGFEMVDSELLADSQFEEFEKNLFEDIMINRQGLQEERVFDSLKKLINENKLQDQEQLTIFTIKEKINHQKQEWLDEEKQFTSKLDWLKEFFTNNQQVLRHIKVAKEENQKVDDGWQLQETINKITKGDYPRKELNLIKGAKDSTILKEIETLVDETNEEILNELDSVDIFNQYIQKSEINEKTISEIVNEFNSIRTDISLDEFKLNINIEGSCNKIQIEAFEILKTLKTWIDTLSCGFIGFNEEQISNAKKITKEAIQRSAKKMVEDFQIKLENDIKNQFASYVKYLFANEKKVKEILKEKRKNQEENLKVTEEVLQQIDDFLSQLDVEIKQ